MKYEIVRPGFGPLLGQYGSLDGAIAACQILNQKIRKKNKRAKDGELKPFLCYVRKVGDNGQVYTEG